MTKASDIFDKVPSTSYHEKLLPVSAEAFHNILQNRRSVRVYTEEAIPEKVTQEVLQWALLAPNSSNLQCWEFYWVKEPHKKKALREACLNQPAARTAQELIVAVARFDTWKKHAHQMLETMEKSEIKSPESVKAYYKKLVPFVYNQGPLNIIGLFKKVILNARGLLRPTPRQPTSHADMRVWANKTVALACENIMLGFSAHGYDTCPMEGFDSSRVKSLLGLGSTAEIVMVISAGKRAESGVYGPRIRMPQEQFIKII